MAKNPLLDLNFLSQLDEYYEKEVWAKVIALDVNENPIEEITGRITGGGSINVDGTSAVRRSCSVSMIAKDVNINDFYWGLHTKFKLFIGLTNFVNPEYPDIIWFPQGLYIITSFSTSHGVNNYSISIQGKDKMCLLNGEISGSLTVPVDFGKLEERDKEGNLTIKDIPVKDIIMEGVHEYAKEPWHNIIINDLDTLGLELLEYKGSKPLYMFIDEDLKEVVNMTLDSEKKVQVIDSTDIITIGSFGENYNQLADEYAGNKNSYYKVYLVDSEGKANTSKTYSVAKIEYGQTAGYRLTDIIYPGDLIANVGDPFTSVLDKLVQMLGNFEYFYDLDGRFVFQMKKTYIQQTWNNLTVSDDKIIADVESTPYGYEFKSGALTVSFANNPNLSSLKNDFSIWGTRKTAAGGEIPIHLRYAIDEKPTYYKTYEGKIYSNKETIDKLLQEIDEAYETIKRDTIYQIETYQKTDVPASLGNDWWEILDWANYYKIITGHYPELSLRNYVPVVDFTLASMNDFKYDFPMPDSSLGESQEQGVNLGSVGYNKITSIFDVYWQEATKRYTLSYCGHGNGCNHPYTYFTNRAETGKGTSYVYKPEIPQATWDKWEEDLNNEKETLKKNYIDTDWREIIYQMAKDYRKHNHDDDFLIKVRENNILAGKYLYPTGYTGYEQYYIDLEGFWRQLYNPDFKIDDPKLGGDGPIETLIEVNDFGHFDECTDAEVYVYPYFILTNDDLSATNEDGVKLYTPDNTYVITKLEDRYDIKPFIKHDSCKLDAKVVYYKFYETNKGQATEIKFEVAEKSILSTLYIKKGEDYVRWIDEKFAEFKLTKDIQYLCAKSNTAKMVGLLDSFIKAMYVSKDGTRFYPHYYEKVMREDGTYYFAKTKIEYYFTDYNYFDEDQGERCYWNKNIWNAPYLLNFWFDFMDAKGEMNKYSVPVIGNRPKVINDSGVKSIYFRETPTVVFVNRSNSAGWEQRNERKSGYTYIQIPDSMLSLFNLSSQGKSAHDMLQECLYNDTYCIESVSMNTIPIYYLKPNTRIYVRNDDSKIDGEYIVSRFTIPLNYSGTMSISATKLADRIN